MRPIDPVIEELRHEAATTRRMLERIPDAKVGWKPHEKSMPLGLLGNHLAELLGWTPAITGADGYDLVTADYVPPEVGTRATILDTFDKNLEAALAVLGSAPDAEWYAPWTFKKDGRVVFQLPRIAVLRSMVVSHMIHHRGQLSVYLRLNNVPLPPIYGPSADEG